jgi:hypothetical protein
VRCCDELRILSTTTSGARLGRGDSHTMRETNTEWDERVFLGK